jgi:uncharacterized membrane protein
VSATDPSTTQQTASASPLDRHGAPVAARGGASGRAIAAFVLGILAVLGALIPIVGIILGIVAIVLAVTQRNDCARTGRAAPWQATAGLILGALAIAASVAIIVVGIASS